MKMKNKLSLFHKLNYKKLIQLYAYYLFIILNNIPLLYFEIN